MKRTVRKFCLWLTPDPEAARYLAALIQDLAGRFDAPVFAPHLTLHGGAIDRSTALDALQKISTQPSYDLEIQGLDASEHFTKTLFVRFRPSPQLEKLRLDFGHLLQLPQLPYDPHLSLLYKEMPLNEKKELARSIKLPFASVRFSGLSLVSHPAEISARQDVEAWRIINCRELVP